MYEYNNTVETFLGTCDNYANVCQLKPMGYITIFVLGLVFVVAIAGIIWYIKGLAESNGK